MKIIIILLILLTGLKASAIELNLNNVIFKNSNNEYFISKDNGNNFQKLRFVDNIFKNQKFISTDEKTFISDDKGAHWKEKNIISLESDESLNLNIYPNPTNQYFSISSETDILEIEVFNIYGSSMLKLTDLNSKLKTINIEALNSGTYTVRIKTEDGLKFHKVLISK